MGCFAATAVSVEKKAVLGSKLIIVHLKGYGGVPVVVILLLFCTEGTSEKQRK